MVRIRHSPGSKTSLMVSDVVTRAAVTSMVEDDTFSRLHSRFTLPLHDASNTINGIIKPLIIIDLVMLQKYNKVLSFKG
jgi:hypothetical protein